MDGVDWTCASGSGKDFGGGYWAVCARFTASTVGTGGMRGESESVFSPSRSVECASSSLGRGMPRTRGTVGDVGEASKSSSSESSANLDLKALRAGISDSESES